MEISHYNLKTIKHDIDVSSNLYLKLEQICYEGDF